MRGFNDQHAEAISFSRPTRVARHQPGAFSFLMEELIDASPPNYGGGCQLMTPIFGLLSFLYIQKTEGPKPSSVWILQALNWLFMIFPIAVILIFMLMFIDFQ